MKFSTSYSKIALVLTLMLCAHFGSFSQSADYAQLKHVTTGFVTFDATATTGTGCVSDVVKLDEASAATSFSLAPTTLCVKQEHLISASAEEVIWKKAYIGARIKNLEYADLHEYDSYSYNITCTFDKINGASSVTNTVVLPLDFSNDANENHTHVSAYLIGAFNEIELTNISITNQDGSAVTTLQKNFEVFIEMHEEVYEPEAFPTGATLTTTQLANGDIELKWEPSVSGEVFASPGWYQLEWKYVPESYVSYTNISTALKTGATRIYLPASCTTYVITNHFTDFDEGAADDGDLYWRVRYVRPFFNASGPSVQSDIREYSDWYNTSSVSQSIKGKIDPKLNWQYDAVYSANGNKKESMAYFDGTGRSRSSLYKLEEYDDMVVASTQEYNYSGASAINVLPAPVKRSTTDVMFGTIPDLNSFQFTSKDDFDVGGSFPDQIGNTYPGASKYYSTNNDWQGTTGEEMMDFVPQADGYPYIFTDFDAEGRPKNVSQPGANGQVQIQSNGQPVVGQHFTQYRYAQPTAAEVDMYLGNHASNETNYRKTITTDPNGQTSVTVTDAKGRTVMTYITNAPDNGPQLDIDTKPEPIYLFENFIGPKKRLNVAKPKRKPSGWELNKTFSLEAVTDVAFDYHIRKPSFNLCQEQTICYDCHYDISIELTNEQGDILFQWISEPVTIDASNIGVNAVCNNVYFDLKSHFFTQGTQGEFNIDLGIEAQIQSNYTAQGDEMIFELPIGTYHLKKTLKVIDEPKIEIMAEDYLTQAEAVGCIDDEFSFIDEATSEANYSCETVYSNIPETPCNGMKVQMMKDLIPISGKYGWYDASLNGPADYSIFRHLMPGGGTWTSITIPNNAGTFSGTPSFQTDFDVCPVALGAGPPPPPPPNGGKICYGVSNTMNPQGNYMHANWANIKYTGAFPTDGQFLGFIPNGAILSPSYLNGGSFTNADFVTDIELTNPGTSVGPLQILWSKTIASQSTGTYKFQVDVFNFGDETNGYYKDSKILAYANGVLIGVIYINDIDYDQISSFVFTHSAFGDIDLELKVDLNCCDYSDLPATFSLFGIDNIKLFEYEAPECDCEDVFGLDQPSFPTYFPYQCLYGTFENANITNNNGVNPALLGPNSFIQAFERHWLEYMLPLHPEYCSYGICEVINSDASLEYVDDLLNLNWTEFEAEHGPSVDYTDDLSGAYEEDPLFNLIQTYSSTSTDPVEVKLMELLDDMEDRMTKYLLVQSSSQSYLDIYKTSSLIAFEAMNMNNGSWLYDNSTLNHHTSRVASIGQASHKEAWWSVYAPLYLQARQEILNSFLSDGCLGCDLGLTELFDDDGSTFVAENTRVKEMVEDWFTELGYPNMTNSNINAEAVAEAAFDDVYDPNSTPKGSMLIDCEDYLTTRIMSKLPVYQALGIDYVDINLNQTGGVPVADVALALSDECACNATMTSVGRVELDDPTDPDPTVLWGTPGYYESDNNIAYEFANALWGYTGSTPTEEFTIDFNPYILKVTGVYDQFNTEMTGAVTSLPQSFTIPGITSGSAPFTTVQNAFPAGYSTSSLTPVTGFTNTYSVNSDIYLWSANTTVTAIPNVTLDQNTITFDRDMIESAMYSDRYMNAHQFFMIQGSNNEWFRGYYIPEPIFDGDMTYADFTAIEYPISVRHDCSEIKSLTESFFEEPWVEDYCTTQTTDLQDEWGFFQTLTGYFNNSFAETIPGLDETYSDLEVAEFVEACDLFHNSGANLSLTYTLNANQLLDQNRAKIHPICSGDVPPYGDDCIDCSLIYKAVMDYQLDGSYVGMEPVSNIETYKNGANYGSISTALGVTLPSGFSASDWDLQYPEFVDRDNWNHMFAVKEDPAGEELVDFLNTTFIELQYQSADPTVPYGSSVTEQSAWAGGFSNSIGWTNSVSALESGLGMGGTTLLDKLAGAQSDECKLWINENSDGNVWFHFAFKGSDLFHDIRIDYEHLNGDFDLTQINYIADGFYPIKGSGSLYDFYVKAILTTTEEVFLRINTTFPVAYVCDMPSVSLYEQPGNNISSWTPNCEEAIYDAAFVNGKKAYQEYRKSEEKNFVRDYIAHCVDQPKYLDEDLYLGRDHGGYNYTLYLYDKAENLIATVPPEGVIPMTETINGKETYDDSGPIATAISDFRADPSGTYINAFGPNAFTDGHYMKTKYDYNAFNEVYVQSTPDGGKSWFHYDKVGRIAFSQNAEQKPRGAYSYTFYDAQSRIYETGEVAINLMPGIVAGDPVVYAMLDASVGMSEASNYLMFTLQSEALNASNIFQTSTIEDEPPFDVVKLIFDYIDYDDWVAFIEFFPRHHVVRTYYDAPPAITIDDYQVDHDPNNRGRVAAMYKYEWLVNNLYEAYDNGIVYHYDPAGNVNRLYREIKDNGFEVSKLMEYEYDQVSGNVLTFHYQRDKKDELIHKYEYDSDNRLTRVRTSRNGVTWEEDATYQYYRHGPLASVTLGERGLQQFDYAYNLNGWLKAFNGMNDITDVYGLAYTQELPVDVLAYELHYNDDDYEPLSSTYASAQPSLISGATDLSMHNGNIAGITMLQRLDNSQSNMRIGRQYQYDQLNRIKSFTEFDVFPVSHQWVSNTNGIGSYYSYDGNGNIQTLDRTGFKTANNPQPMDMLDYSYNPNNNQLENFCESVGANEFENDLDNSGIGVEYAYVYEVLNYAPASVDLIVSTCACPDFTNGPPASSEFNCSGVANNDIYNHFNLAEGSADYFLESVACEIETLTVQIDMVNQLCVGGETNTQFVKMVVATVPSIPIYTYDEIGNLIEDDNEGLDIDWNPIGKVKEVDGYKNSESDFIGSTGGVFNAWNGLPTGLPTAEDMVTEDAIAGGADTYTAQLHSWGLHDYDYDPMGERIRKFTNTTEAVSYTYYTGLEGDYSVVGGISTIPQDKPKAHYYMRDAQGNTIAMYRLDTALTEEVPFYSGVLGNLQAYLGIPQASVWSDLVLPMFERSSPLKQVVMANMSSVISDSVIEDSIIDQTDVINAFPEIGHDLIMSGTHAQDFYDHDKANVKALIRTTSQFEVYADQHSLYLAEQDLAAELAFYNQHQPTLNADITAAKLTWEQCVNAQCPVMAPCATCEDIRILDPYDPAYATCLSNNNCDVNTCSPCLTDWNNYDALANLLTFQDRLNALKLSYYNDLMTGTLGLNNDHYEDGSGDLNTMALSSMPTDEVVLDGLFFSYLAAHYSVTPEWVDEIWPICDRREVLDHFIYEHIAGIGVGTGSDWYADALDHLTDGESTDKGNLTNAATLIAAAGEAYTVTDFFDEFNEAYTFHVMEWMLGDASRGPGTGFGKDLPYDGEVDHGDLPHTPYQYIGYDLEPLEYYVYGSQRLGMIKHYLARDNYTDRYTDMGGKKQYEITDHLGNVRLTISNRKLAKDPTEGDPHFENDVVSSMDYYPFGMPMPMRWHNYEPEDEATFNIASNVTESEFVLKNYEKPISGAFPFTTAQINDYWEGRGAAYDLYSGNVHMSELYSGSLNSGSTVTSWVPHTYTQTNSSSATGSIYLTSTGSQLTLGYGSSDNNTIIGLFREIGHNTEFEMTGIDQDDKLTLTVYVAQRGALYDNVQVSLLDDQHNVIKYEMKTNMQDNYFYKVTLTVDNDDLVNSVGANWSSTANYYILVATTMQDGSTLSSNGISPGILLTDFRLKYHKLVETEVSTVDANTFVYQPHYRYGFQGQERADEIAGIGNSYTAAFWQYDPRLGRRWNVDPILKYHESPYAVFANNPIMFVDPTGLDTTIYSGKSEYDEESQMFLAVPDMILKGGEDINLFKHAEGKIEVNGETYIEIWSRFSISGHDATKEQTNGQLVDDIDAAWVSDFEGDQNVSDWGYKQLYNGAKGGALDIAYNGWITKNTRGTRNSLFLINGKYANANEAGNYYIGLAYGMNGRYSLSLLQMGGDTWEKMYGGSAGADGDDKHEKLMLHMGYDRGDAWKNDRNYSPRSSFYQNLYK